jgi:5-methylcytosine-specific restriction endonuclease McrA
MNTLSLPNKTGSNNTNWNGGTCAYKKYARKMFGDNCQMCGSEKQIHVHHRDFNHSNNPLDGSNWQILCRSCHSKVHDFSKNFKGKEPWRK